MINELIKLATHLDKRGLRKEADYLDSVIKKYAGDIEDMFADMGAHMGDLGQVSDALYPENEAAIPGVIEAMNAEIEALGPPGEGLRARSAHADKESSITLKYGLVGQDNASYFFKLKDGTEVKVAK